MPISPEKQKALQVARQSRAVAAERVAPEGYRSVEHFLDCVRERLGSRTGATAALAAYLGVTERSVRRWAKREKLPMQGTIDAMARWMECNR